MDSRNDASGHCAVSTVNTDEEAILLRPSCSPPRGASLRGTHPSVLNPSAGDGESIRRPHVSDTDRTEALARSRFERETPSLRKRIDAWAYRLLGNRTDAEDIVQETLLRAWHTYPTFDASHSFDAWVYRIAVNLCYDQLRSRKRRRVESLEALGVMGKDNQRIRCELADLSSDPEACLMATQIDERLLLAIWALPSSYRACLGMFESGLDYEEMARVCQCPLGTIRSRLSRARNMVREAMATP